MAPLVKTSASAQIVGQLATGLGLAFGLGWLSSSVQQPRLG